MQKYKFLLSLLILTSSLLFSQERKLPIDTTITTQHSVTINGTPINYTAKVGTQPVWNDKGQPVASLHYT